MKSPAGASSFLCYRSVAVDLQSYGWLAALRRYFVFVAVANLLWEIAHLPLYTIWSEGTWREMAFAVVHCTGGDVLISVASLALALLLAGHPRWPARRFSRVAVLTVGFGFGYTLFSEWLNIVVRESWEYSELMPLVPVVNAGLSPVAQWLVIPVIGLMLARRAALIRIG